MLTDTTQFATLINQMKLDNAELIRQRSGLLAQLKIALAEISELRAEVQSLSHAGVE